MPELNESDTLISVWVEVVDYLENLGDDRCGTMNLSFRRTDDFRRKVMTANKSPLIYFNARIYINLFPEEIKPAHSGLTTEVFQGISTDPAEAIRQALDQLKAFLS
ncbi:MAG: hypothetical protein EBR82_72010 [Caulobacteraceae bacterium]|nr:hypothetical protein [Caulobacteraceae bacterium]